MDEVQLGKKIGEGAMALIYIATLRGRTCVAKKLRNGVDSNSQAYKDLIMELDIMMTVGAHPNLVEFYGAVIIDPKNPIILEEFVSGPNMESYLQSRNGKPLERRTVYGWTLDLLRALDFLHNRNPIIIHRDLKPANMMLSKDLSTVKLADFGMSKKINQAERETMINKGHTGTLRYMAPEVVAKATAHYNDKADIYSAAIIIWYIATSRRPPLKDKFDIVGRPDVNAVTWPELGALLQTMWNGDPGFRPSAQQCVVSLANMNGKPEIAEGVAPSPESGCACNIQ